MEDTIEIRLRGEGITPGLIRSHELAELMEALEDLVTAETLKNNLSLKKEELVVGLYEIADKSIGLKFKTSHPAIAIPAFSAAAYDLATGNLDSLASQSIKSIHVISAFTKRHSAVTEFKVQGIEQPIAVITPDTFIPSPHKIVGQTEIFAKVLRVGGKVSKAMLELQDGSVIYSEVPVDIAIKLGHHLYKTAIFSGTAKWCPNSLELEEFSISGFYDFPTRSPEETFSEIRALAKEQFDKITSVDEFVSSTRRGEDFQ